MGKLQDLALTEAAYRVLADDISARRAQVDAETQAAMREDGARTVDVALPDGTQVASVYTKGGTPPAVVADERAFLAWVREYAPDNVVSYVVTEVRPAYRRKLLADLTKKGAAEMPDRTTGEIAPVGGVKISEKAPTPTHVLRLDDGAAVAIGQAWRAGELGHLRMLPQLAPAPPGDDQAPADGVDQAADAEGSTP